ncbi:MAG: dienelactone hydrolase family protein [Gammaproteobacteria bacterium]|nr:dienelactone hydrolase family protein [Gammaproteobacteria bacterium]
MQQTSNILECVELQTAKQVRNSVIWLHGLGADGHDFEAIVPELHLPAELGGVRFIFPHAPIRPITVNSQQTMRAWYDLTSMDFEYPQDRAGILHSCAQVEQLIQRENQRGITHEQIILAGFSQGGAIALHCGLHTPQPLAGLMILSSYLPLPKDLKHPHKNQPIFIAHGQHDPVIPLQVAQHSYQNLAQKQIPFEWHEYPMAHSLCDAEINDISIWLQKTLSG